MIYMTKRDVQAVHYMFDAIFSWKAKGLLTHLITACNGETISIRGISKYARDGRDGTKAAMDELIAAGYIRFEENTYVVSELQTELRRKGGN